MDAGALFCRWIGLRDASASSFAPAGLGRPHPSSTSTTPPLAESATPARGTIRIERLADPANSPENVLRMSMRDPDPLLFTIRIDPDGTVALLMRRGQTDLLVTLDLPACPAGSRMTIQYGWDLDARLGYFWAEVPSIGAYCIRPIPSSLGLSMAELRRLVDDPQACQISDEVIYVAAAEGLAPAGPLPGLDGAGLVETKDGQLKPLASIARGDEVKAADGAPAQVRWVGSSEMPAGGRMEPFRVNTPYHGARTPLVLAGTARLRLGGIAVEYLFGETEVAVQVRHLRDNVAIVPARHAHELLSDPLIRYYQLVLDRPVPIRLSGVVVETLDCSQLRGNPNLHFRSVLTALPPEILSPEIATQCKLLRVYEAQSLRQMQAA
ncbi:Hint domain-containing protein [Ponticoccus sp. SC2-23]|uniref:Hint domain-containing protein n=1 Tax=Alexandriicola marinus TaxID=2081710 RepID=UPI000FDC75DA|nr:Hint domain-containing protein [Alexandriicola marinus]MBM1220630.1 Hint domain-containing protein [Ponticoccus sp. SC6-9]MBM1225316.1 Hint domain-containing protein [Ponticoccus sp. SC6-15]MBM1228830.1 Hint domain-containing protein [Ponticoccus sp. SC6-38]MBM1233533.1 Hint domain-containing protein [Ponticoccus sp. SC6-45]MBM1239331.1 Hint domain-containing protein [Ponticoccus sp. SC6-49]MBM1243113.1 Hint domain-containing protein [Ponticoccus sp. SC2-64]MBM1247057.1 Hint domain-contai